MRDLQAVLLRRGADQNRTGVPFLWASDFVTRPNVSERVEGLSVPARQADLGNTRSETFGNRMQENAQ